MASRCRWRSLTDWARVLLVRFFSLSLLLQLKHCKRIIINPVCEKSHTQLRSPSVALLSHMCSYSAPAPWYRANHHRNHRVITMAKRSLPPLYAQFGLTKCSPVRALCWSCLVQSPCPAIVWNHAAAPFPSRCQGPHSTCLPSFYSPLAAANLNCCGDYFYPLQHTDMTLLVEKIWIDRHWCIAIIW